jgi:hypothetical protein
MKVLFILWLTLIAQMSLAQERLGYSYKYITTEFAFNGNDSMSYGHYTDGTLYLRVGLVKEDVYYVFNSDSICIITEVYPRTNEDLKELDVMYGISGYALACPGVWIGPCLNGICKGELVENKYFVWTELRRSGDQ